MPYTIGIALIVTPIIDPTRPKFYILLDHKSILVVS